MVIKTNSDNIKFYRSKLQNFSSLKWFHWIVLLFSVIVTFSAWYISRDQFSDNVSNRFEKESNHVINLITDRLKRYEDALSSGVAMVESQNYKLDHLKWKKFANALEIEKKYPGINGIGVIDHLKNRTEFNRYLKKQKVDRSNFIVYPRHFRQEFFPVTYIEPLHSNKEALGLDLAHENNRYDAAKKAQFTEKPQITAPIVLVQDKKKTPGFLFFMPFYEKNKFMGIVYAPFITDRLMEGILRKETRHVSVKISDGDDLIYNENNSKEEDFDPDPIFKKKYKLNVYGRVWEFEIWSAKSFRNSSFNPQPLMILIGGLIIDVLLLILFLILSNSNKKIIDITKSIIREYRRKNRDFVKLENISRSIIDNLPDGLITIDKTGNIEGFNLKCERMFLTKKKSMIDKNISEIILRPKGYKTNNINYLKKSGLIAQKANGVRFMVEISFNEIKVGSKEYFNLIIHDLNDDK